MYFQRVLILLFTITSFKAHAQFQLLAVANQDICEWKLKNTDTVAHKMTSISFHFFHQKPDIVFSPALSFPGGGKYQFKGSFNGSSKMKFKFKTVQINSLDTLLQPGGTLLASITVNAGNYKDTILAAGVKVYYSDNSTAKTAEVYPAGVSPCPSEAIFINAGSTNAGIKLGSFANGVLHDGLCEPQLVAIIFDGHTLKRKGLANFIPHCPTGRLWTTFGNLDDYEIYYSFDVTKQKHRLEFDSFINAIPIGDYVALTNKSMISLAWFDSISTSLAKIGYTTPPFGDTIGYFTMVGKKGATSGEANFNFCKDPHGTCYVSIEQSLIQDDTSNTLVDFSPCYETMVQYLAKTVPLNADPLSLLALNVYPNPSATGWAIDDIGTPYNYSILNLNGMLLQSGKANGKTFISGLNLRPAIYILRINTWQNHTYSSRLIKTQ